MPKLNTQTFELNVPSTDEKVKYRPFLVKEEKILLQAQEGEQKEMFNALSDVVRACTFDKVVIVRLPSFDVEYGTSDVEDGGLDSSETKELQPT